MENALNEFAKMPLTLTDDILSAFDLPLSTIIILYALFFIAGYLIGSIPFGLIFTRLAGLGDVRSIGSGNIGATNVLRTGNKKIAALTLLCDMLKGTLAVYIGYYICRAPSCYPAILLIGFGAFIGHLFPVWLKFKGGKGVATYLGVCLGFYWPLAVIFALTWLLTAKISRYSSLSALIAVVIVPLFAFFLTCNTAVYYLTITLHRYIETLPYTLYITLVLMSIFVFIKHRSNIFRLIKGIESKIGKKANNGKT